MRKVFLLCVVCGTLAVSFAQQPPTNAGSDNPAKGPVFRVGGAISAPRVVSAPDPQYSREARRAHIQGTVVLWMIVGPDGRPHDIKVKQGLGYGLDEQAIKAVQKWRFKPARKGKQPVAVQINVQVNFRD